MKIFLACSKAFYDKLEDLSKKLIIMGHECFMPNCYDKPETEALVRGTVHHADFKERMFRQSEDVIKNMDAILVLNYDKNDIENYIGGATFLEMYDAFRYNKKIFLMNDIPNNMLKDEIIGLKPIIINSNINLII